MAILGLAALVSGCGESYAPAPLCDGAPCPVERIVTDLFQVRLDFRTEILFVVDDSSSMKGFEAAVGMGYAQVARALQASYGGLPRLRLAAVPASAASGTAGCQPASSRAVVCGLRSPDTFLSTESCGSKPNFAGDFESTVACLGTFGTDGCGSLEPLSAMRRALGGDPAGAGLPGFSDPRTTLFVVIIAGRDDASQRAGEPIPVSDFVDFLKGLKADPWNVVVSVAGPVPGCGGADGPTAVGPRLKAFVDAFAGNGTYQGVCGGAGSAWLRDLPYGYHLGSPCLLGVRDTDLSQPGLQAECDVEDSSTPAEAQALTPLVPIPSCDRGPPPCWKLSFSNSCPPGSSLVEVDRGVSWCPQSGMNLRVSCLGCADAGDPACAGP